MNVCNAPWIHFSQSGLPTALPGASRQESLSHGGQERMIAPSFLALGPVLQSRLIDLPEPVFQTPESGWHVNQTLSYFNSLDLTQDTLMGMTRGALSPGDLTQALGRIATYIGGGITGIELENRTWEGLQGIVSLRYRRCDPEEMAAAERDPVLDGVYFFIKSLVRDVLYRPDIRDPDSVLFLQHVLFPIARVFSAQGWAGVRQAVCVLGCRQGSGRPSRLETLCTGSYRKKFNRRVKEWYLNEYEAHDTYHRQAMGLSPSMYYVGRNAHTSPMLMTPQRPLSAHWPSPPRSLSVPAMPDDNIPPWVMPPNNAELMNMAHFIHDDNQELWSHAVGQPEAQATTHDRAWSPFNL
jgi:hypothetical protein